MVWRSIEPPSTLRMLVDSMRRPLGSLKKPLGKTIRIKLDSVEKAWNATVQATSALILRLVEKLPSSHWERRKMLRELETRVPEVEELMLREGMELGNDVCVK